MYKRYFPIYLITLLFFGLFAGSCDRVVRPEVIITDLDTNLFPGNFIDYEFPTFEQNENTLRNVLIEDFTGHRCAGCPYASTIAQGLESEYPDRVFSIAIHAGYGGVTNLQEVNAVYPYDFTTAEGVAMAIDYTNGDFGFLSNPTGTVNRVASGSGNLFTGPGFWSDRTDEMLATGLNINLQAKSNYFPSTNGVYLHVESEFINQLDGTFNILTFAVQNSIIAPQLQGSDIIPNYNHHNVHIGNAYGEPFGRLLSHGVIQQNATLKTDFSYQLPAGITNEDMHFLVVVFNRDTYEVEQVIKHEF